MREPVCQWCWEHAPYGMEERADIQLHGIWLCRGHYERTLWLFEHDIFALARLGLGLVVARLCMVRGLS